MSDTNQIVRLPNADPIVVDVFGRVTRLESDVSTIKAQNQIHNTDMALMKLDMSYVKESVGGIQKGINKILWAIGLSVITASSAFVLSGGLAIIQQ